MRLSAIEWAASDSRAGEPETTPATALARQMTRLAARATHTVRRVSPSRPAASDVPTASDVQVPSAGPDTRTGPAASGPRSVPVPGAARDFPLRMCAIRRGCSVAAPANLRTRGAGPGGIRWRSVPGVWIMDDHAPSREDPPYDP
ncbi:hypothetical protein Slala03_40920 [Streptomyces lavendulae subsp. lavendulae]|nr:hypothetical protein Slala03_40920 [Streptomyces lavendulae subsp. lavendulae]